MGTTNQIDDAIAVVRAAFEDGASETTINHGARMLETMLSSLQGAIGAQEAPEEPASPKTAGESAPAPAKPATPDLLDAVIGMLKSHLDETDQAMVESSSEHSFSVPFIHL